MDYHFFSTCAIVEAFPICYADSMREPRQRVILCGDTMFLEGIRVSLEAFQGVEVVLLDPSTDEQFENTGRVRPAAVIFDLSAIQPNSLFSLLQQTDLLLIGIDPETHQALVWSGRQAGAVMAGDLIRIIQQKE